MHLLCTANGWRFSSAIAFTANQVFPTRTCAIEAARIAGWSVSESNVCTRAHIALNRTY